MFMGATGKRVMCKINLIHKNEVIYAKILTMVNSERVTDDFFSSIFSIFFKFSIKKKIKACVLLTGQSVMDSVRVSLFCLEK